MPSPSGVAFFWRRRGVFSRPAAWRLQLCLASRGVLQAVDVDCGQLVGRRLKDAVLSCAWTATVPAARFAAQSRLSDHLPCRFHRQEHVELVVLQTAKPNLGIERPRGVILGIRLDDRRCDRLRPGRRHAQGDGKPCRPRFFSLATPYPRQAARAASSAVAFLQAARLVPETRSLRSGRPQV